MKKMKALIAKIKEMGGILIAPVTLEAEITSIGYEMENRRMRGESIHEGGLPARIERACDWATAANLSRTSYNYFLDLGAQVARKGR